MSTKLISKSADGSKCMVIHKGRTVHLKRTGSMWTRLIKYRHEEGSKQPVGGVVVAFENQVIA